jgi:quercetin dioxygenase-like cupin family protein
VRIPTGLTRTELRTCTGEQFFYVVDGEVELEVDEKKVTLRAGDSSHYQSTAPRRWTNTREKEAVVVCVGATMTPFRG